MQFIPANLNVNSQWSLMPLLLRDDRLLDYEDGAMSRADPQCHSFIPVPAHGLEMLLGRLSTPPRNIDPVNVLHD